MRRLGFTFFLACCSVLCYAQEGIQFGGVLSANLIDDFNSNTAYADNNAGYTYFQLNGSFKDGPFGLESQLQFGPVPVNNPTGISNLYFHYGYGYANLPGGGIYLAVGRIIDISTFGLNSYYQLGPNGPGVYGSAVARTGLSGFGIDGLELRLTPVENLVFGIVMPYNISGLPIVNSTLKGTRFVASYTFPKLVQLVLGYQQRLIGVADYLQPPSTVVDPNTLLNKNKLYVLANLLMSEDLTAGLRDELDHDVSTSKILSNNVYATLGAKIGNFSIGADAGISIPTSGSAGMEVLGLTSYTFPGVLPSVDLQPYIQAGYFTADYPMVTDLTGVTYVNGFDIDNYIIFNPQLKLLLGKSQHELVLGYTLTYDLNTAQVILNQLNLMMQIYF